MSEQNYKDVALRQYVVHHKQAERRMDGSAGSFYCALLETVSKEGYYFTGTEFDDELHLVHTITNDFERIPELIGYKPIRSDSAKVYPAIKQLLENNEKVIFCGTSSQCRDLKNLVEDHDNLYLVNIVDNLFASENVLKTYIEDIQHRYQSKVKDIRFFDKEFSYSKAKRIKLSNGRVIFSRKQDLFDECYENELITTALDEQNLNLQVSNIGDLTIGAYDLGKGDDDLGYSYISVNSEKGTFLFDKVRKRLNIVLTDEQIDDANIVTDQTTLNKLKADINNKGLKTKVKRILKKLGFANLITMVLCVLDASQFKIKPIFQFIRYNFFSKNIITDKKHNGYVYFTPHCSFQLEKDAIIEVHGPLVIGAKRVKCSKQDTRVWMQSKSKIIVYENASFGYGSNIEIYKDALLEIGSLFSNSEFVLICGKHISIGSPVNIARGCTIRDTNGHLVIVPGFKKTRDVEIGNHVWVCSNSTIMPGTIIGDGAIVGACSFITKKIPPFTMVQGEVDKVVGYPKYFKM